MCANLSQHWDSSYSTGDRSRSWYQGHADISVRLVKTAEPDLDAGIIDAGGGASTFVDDLLAAGYRDISVLDVSPNGIDIARTRLGDVGSRVTWIVEDLLAWNPVRRYNVWHDRAVLKVGANRIVMPGDSFKIP